MKSKMLIPAVFAALVSTNVLAQAADQTGAPAPDATADQAQSETAQPPMPPGPMPQMGQYGRMDPQMMRQMMEQRRQMMQGGPQGMPMGGSPMMSPEMRQWMQDMQQRRAQMMGGAQPGPGMMAGAGEQNAIDDHVPTPPDDAASAPDMSSDGMPGGMAMQGTPPACQHMMKGRGAMGGMKQEMMAMRQQHMERMEQHMQNIEALLQQLIEMQKAQ